MSKPTEEALRDEWKARFQARKMEVVGQLAGGVAHEFNNLLQIIQGNTDLAASHLDTGHPAYESLTEVSRAVDRAAVLVNQLLTVSGRVPPRREQFDINIAVTELATRFRRLTEANITLDLCLSPELKMVHADRSQVEQALANLCFNARDAMPDGGDDCHQHGPPRTFAGRGGGRRNHPGGWLGLRRGQRYRPRDSARDPGSRF